MKVSILVSADPDVHEIAYQYGRNVGIAFQVSHDNDSTDSSFNNWQMISVCKARCLRQESKGKITNEKKEKKNEKQTKNQKELTKNEKIMTKN